MFKKNAAKLTVCAVAAVAAIALAGCGGSGSNSTPAQGDGGAPEAQEEAASGVGLHDACYMWDQELISELEAEGYKQKTSDNESVTYAKDGIEVLVSESGGYRIYAFVGDETKDMYSFIADNAPDVANLGEYSDGKSNYVVGTATVAHDDGVVVGSASAVFIVLPGHFEQLMGFASNVDVNNGMSAQTAAARVVQAVNAAGYELSRGEGIDSGFAEATTDPSNNAEFDAQVGGGSNGSGATTDEGKQLYTGTWVDPEYGDTLTFNSDGTLTIKQVGEGSTTWWWSETNNGIHIENAANSYDLTLAGDAKTYFLYNDAKGIRFDKN